MHDARPTISIVGVTGAVGTEALSILEERGYPAASIRCFGSHRSAGGTIRYGESELTIRPRDEISREPSDYALLCADAETARYARETLSQAPTVVIDNSSAFRMDPDVPLVIPEINADLITKETRVIANPNCSTIMMLIAINPIRSRFGVRGVTVTTYQAVSGAGRAGIDELRLQSQAYLRNERAPSRVFPRPCAFNVFEHESPLDPASGFNGEELKMINETRRIWDDQALPILPTCVRVPVERAHAQSIIVDIDQPASTIGIQSCLAKAGIRTLEPGQSLTPRDAAGTDGVIVGRIRSDPATGGRRLVLWVCCDQIRKGAALNAIQIMETIEHRYKKSTRLGKACAEEQNRKVLA